ncbi:hypothetical protein C8Q70DRAFT_374895 [Cubamyces menziesii]|nr:hypothetical protein C8Q70DRAFT_374895 [Cubamyces menziesii]
MNSWHWQFEVDARAIQNKLSVGLAAVAIPISCAFATHILTSASPFHPNYLPPNIIITFLYVPPRYRTRCACRPANSYGHLTARDVLISHPSHIPSTPIPCTHAHSSPHVALRPPTSPGESSAAAPPHLLLPLLTWLSISSPCSSRTDSQHRDICLCGTSLIPLRLPGSSHCWTGNSLKSEYVSLWSARCSCLSVGPAGSCLLRRVSACPVLGIRRTGWPVRTVCGSSYEGVALGVTHVRCVPVRPAGPRELSIVLRHPSSVLWQLRGQKAGAWGGRFRCALVTDIWLALG